MPWRRNVAAELLKTDWIAAIWKLHVVAARVYRDGYPAQAEKLQRIADAAENAVSRTAVDEGFCTPAVAPRRPKISSITRTREGS